MSTISSTQRESRNNTVSEYNNDPINTRRARFPSLHLETTQDFVSPGWNDRLPGEESIKLTVPERVWYWLCGISRKVWLIVAGIVIACLSIMIVGVILIFVLPRNSSAQLNPDAGTTPIVISVSTTVTTREPPSPYPQIYSSGQDSKWYPIGKMESLEPDNRGYVFRDRIIAYGKNASYLLLKTAQYQSLSPVAAPDDCTACCLLSATDICLNGGFCSLNETIFSCKSCGQTPNVCLLHGSSIVTAGKIIEWRISTDGNQLLLTNAVEQGMETVVQTMRSNDSKFFENGPMEIFPISSKSLVASVSLDPNDSNETDLVVWLNSSGTLMLDYQGEIFTVLLDVNGPALTIDTTYFQNYALIVVLEKSHYYVVRLNFDNNCISLSPPLNSYSDLTLMGSFWAADQYYLWYNDIKTTEGVVIQRFSYIWPNDSPCPYH